MRIASAAIRKVRYEILQSLIVFALDGMLLEQRAARQ
jgi:hypothetical protein